MTIDQLPSNIKEEMLKRREEIHGKAVYTEEDVLALLEIPMNFIVRVGEAHVKTMNLFLKMPFPKDIRDQINIIINDIQTKTDKFSGK